MKGFCERWCEAARHFISKDSSAEHLLKWRRGPPGVGRSRMPLLPNITHCSVSPAAPRCFRMKALRSGSSTATPLHAWPTVTQNPEAHQLHSMTHTHHAQC